MDQAWRLPHVAPPLPRKEPSDERLVFRLASKAAAVEGEGVGVGGRGGCATRRHHFEYQNTNRRDLKK